LSGEAVFLHSAGVLGLVSRALFQQSQIVGSAFDDGVEGEDGSVVKQLRGVGGVAIEIGDEFADDGVDVGEFEPAGEGEMRLLRGVSIGGVRDGEGEVEITFGDEREKSVVLGREDGAGGGIGKEGEHGWAGKKARHWVESSKLKVES
jgi:hypothetical protein